MDTTATGQVSAISRDIDCQRCPEPETEHSGEPGIHDQLMDVASSTQELKGVAAQLKTLGG
ncbi:MAG TPA: hypothetical protein VFX41_03725 [Actinomycetales bacterium]|nr:hypothetical protein [Actinomycetales bacterium]